MKNRINFSDVKYINGVKATPTDRKALLKRVMNGTIKITAIRLTAKGNIAIDTID